MLRKLSFYLLSIASLALPLSFAISCSNSKDTKPNTDENPKPDGNGGQNDEGGNSNGSGESDKPNGDSGQGGGSGDSNGSKPKPIGPELKAAIESINSLQHKTFRAMYPPSSSARASGISLVLAISNGDDPETALTTNLTKLTNSNVKLDSNVDELIKTIQDLKKQNFTFAISSFSYGDLYQNYVKGVNFKITISYQNESAKTENFWINNLGKIDANNVQEEINAIKSVTVDCTGTNKPQWNDKTNVFTALFDPKTGILSKEKDANILWLKNILEKIKGVGFQFSSITNDVDKISFQIKVANSVPKPHPPTFTLTGFSS